MPTLGAIADDFTGATDLATMLVSRGFRTLVAIGADAGAVLHLDADLLGRHVHHRRLRPRGVVVGERAV
ncbi:four-carbon acid sugar kinase family protein, partial [Streptomyces albidoflavus]